MNIVAAALLSETVALTLTDRTEARTPEQQCLLEWPYGTRIFIILYFVFHPFVHGFVSFQETKNVFFSTQPLGLPPLVLDLHSCCRQLLKFGGLGSRFSRQGGIGTKYPQWALNQTEEKSYYGSGLFVNLIPDLFWTFCCELFIVFILVFTIYYFAFYLFVSQRLWIQTVTGTWQLEITLEFVYIAFLNILTREKSLWWNTFRPMTIAGFAFPRFMAHHESDRSVVVETAGKTAPRCVTWFARDLISVAVVLIASTGAHVSCDSQRPVLISHRNSLDVTNWIARIS